MANTNDPRDPDQQPEEGTAETWQEETPPADDFHDTPEADAPATAEHDQTVQETNNKTKGNLVFFGVLAVAALVVGGLAVSQIFKPQDSGLAEPSQVALAGGNPLNPAAGVSGANAVTGTSANPAAEQAAANALGVDPTVAPTDMAQAPSDPAMASALPAPTPALPPTQAVPPQAAMQQAPVPASVSMAADTTAVPPLPVANSSGAAAPTTNAAMEGRINQLETQLLTLQQSMDRTAQELFQVSAKLSTMPMLAQSANPDLEQKLNQLQQQVENMAARQQAAPKAVYTPKAEKPSERRPVREASNRNPNRSAPAPKTSKKWVLRAATPDSAWVSAGANAPDLKRVAVGDSLPGIGKVKEIRQSRGQWQVIGTAGTVR